MLIINTIIHKYKRCNNVKKNFTVFHKHSLSQWTCVGDESILWLFFLLWFILNHHNSCPKMNWGEGVLPVNNMKLLLIVTSEEASCIVSCCVSYTLIRHQETWFSISRPERARPEENTLNRRLHVYLSVNASETNYVI